MKKIILMLVCLMMAVCSAEAEASSLPLGTVVDDQVILPAITGKAGLVILFDGDEMTIRLLKEYVEPTGGIIGLLEIPSTDPREELRLSLGLSQSGVGLALLDGGRKLRTIRNEGLENEEDLKNFLSALPSSVPDTEGNAVYRIHVLNSCGEGVPKVYVQFCDDSTCRSAKSDQNGEIVMTAPPEKYDIHIIKVPKGYEKPEEALLLPESGGEITLLLEESR